MTTVVIKYLKSDISLRINCKDHIYNISLYKDKLGILFGDKIIVYQLLLNDNNELSYKAICKINMKGICKGFNIATNSYLWFKKNNLICQSFQGQFIREWSFESEIKSTYMMGGLTDCECLFVILENGII